MVKQDGHVRNVLFDTWIKHFNVGILRLSIEVLHIIDDVLLLFLGVKLPLHLILTLHRNELPHFFLLLVELLASVLHVIGRIQSSFRHSFGLLS
jgi:hypothetical protein